MNRFCFFAIIFTLLSVAYTTASNRCCEVVYTVCTPVCADSVSFSQTDTLSVAVPDTALVAADTTVAVADSVLVDSMALTKIIPDSLVVGYIPPRTSWKYFNVQERSDEDVAKLKTLYKKTLAEHNGALNAYDGWKVAFNSTNDRTLDMYLDGARMILSRYCADTLNHRYDRLSEHRDELMELYDLAIHNLDKLNAQLDMSKVKDTLSVAKFRSRQLRYYRDITVLDSIYNGDSINRCMPKDTLMNIINNDITHLRFMYPRYKEIVTSTDMNVDMVDIAMFAILSDIRIVRDREIGLNQDTRKSNAYADTLLFISRRNELMAYIENPNNLLYKNHLYSNTGKTLGFHFANQNIAIEKVLMTMKSRFVDMSSFDNVEEYYAGVLEKGDFDAVLNGPLEKFPQSEVYLLTMRYKYQKTPSFDLAKKIYERAKKKKDKKNAKEFLVKYIGFKEEFNQLSAYTKSQYYVQLAMYEHEANKNTKALEYLNTAKKLCPGYPEIYFLEASCLNALLYRDSKIHEEAAKRKYWFMYDLVAVALDKVKVINANSESEIKTSLNEEILNNKLKEYESYFPEISILFFLGGDYTINEGDTFEIQLQKRTYRTKARSCPVN